MNFLFGRKKTEPEEASAFLLKEIDAKVEIFERELAAFSSLLKERPELLQEYANNTEDRLRKLTINEHYEMLEVLMDNGLDPIKTQLLEFVCDVLMTSNMRFRMHFSSGKETKIIDKMISHFNYYEDFDNEKSPLHDALYSYSETLFKALLDLGYSLDKANQGSYPLLFKMISTRAWDIIELTKEYPVDFYVKGAFGGDVFTELLSLNDSEKEKVESYIDFLFSKNLDFKRFDLEPIYVLASEKGFDRLVRVCLENGVQPNSKNKKGETPLMMYSQRGNLQMVNLLFSYGADANMRNEEGKTALQLNPHYENFMICMTLNEQMEKNK